MIKVPFFYPIILLFVVSAMLYVISSRNSQRDSYSVVKNNKNKTVLIENNNNLQEISKKKAFEVARVAIGKIKYSKTLPIVFKDVAGEYLITFPIDKPETTPHFYRGPDYAAEVHVDKKTGKAIVFLSPQ